MQDCSDYQTVNAIRVLNNSFKHNNGYYKPKNDNPDNKINESMLAKWSILDDRDKIDYSKLPIKDLIIACNAFCNDLLNKLEKELKTRAVPKEE